MKKEGFLNQMGHYDNENMTVAMEKEKVVRQSRMVGEEEDTIDLLELAYCLLDHISAIIVAVLLGAILLTGYAKLCISPTYASTAKLYVVSASSGSVVNLSDLNLGTSLTKDYEELMTSYPVMDQVSERLNLDWSTSDLNRVVSISNISDTRILNITAVTTDPALSRDIANTVAEVAVKYLPETMSTDQPNIAQKARLASEPVGPSYRKYLMMGAMLGGMLSCGFFILRHLMDDSIKTEEDVEKYLGEVTLASIPYHRDLDYDADKESKRSGRMSKKAKGGK